MAPAVVDDVNLVAYIIAVVLFVLAAAGVTAGDLTELDIVALGLAFFALGHISPPRP